MNNYIEGRIPMRALFVGRFQPFHKGHLYAIDKILKEADELIIVVGSAQMSHEHDNPFTAGERLEMIRHALNEAEISPACYMLIPIPDAPAHRVWVSQVESQTPSFEIVYTNQPLTRRLLIEAGYKVKGIKLHMRDRYEATEIRERILDNKDWIDLVPPSVYEYVKNIDGEGRIRDLAKSDSITHNHKRNSI
jgi:nicotinamide-nucleotide adenylyltransferase